MTYIHINDIKFDRKEYEEKCKKYNNPVDPPEVLIRDIKEHGILTPLTIFKDGTIFDGDWRYLAAKELNITMIPVEYYEDAYD